MVLKARKNIFSFEGTPSEKEDKDPVTIAGRPHLYPSRTQKLSSLAPMILGGKLPGKVGRCRFFLFFEFKPAASLLSESTLFSDCTGFAVRLKSVKLGSGLVIWTLPVFFYLNLGFTIREKNWARAKSVARLFFIFWIQTGSVSTFRKYAFPWLYRLRRKDEKRETRRRPRYMDVAVFFIDT